MSAKLFIYSLFVCMWFSCNSNPSIKESKSVIAKDTIAKDAIVKDTIAKDSTAKNAGVSITYNLNKPNRQWKLPPVLIEVSGNTWIDEDHLILIEDRSAILYYVRIDGATAILENTVPFAGKALYNFDIEDVTYVNGIVYALWSHGDLFKINNWQTKPDVEKIKTGLKNENNTEGLCYDSVTKMLLIACKDDSGIRGAKKSTKAVYAFDITRNKLIAKPFLIIKKADFKNVTEDEISFNPSAIAIHPVNHDIYLLSTRDNKGMAIFTRKGTLKSYQSIDKDLMPQPEGICFSPEGKLYISSESKMGEPGNLFEFNPSSH